jgi:predicted nucleic-acid-binding protein
MYFLSHLNKSPIHLPQDVLFEIVYVPPENYKYCIGDPFNEIENELLVNLFFICNIKPGKLISSASSVFVSTKQSMS